MAATGESLLTTFQKHIEDMRGLTLCKICLRPFYEPFTLACGHTYCYSCLRDWLHRSREQTADKGCPDCRQKIKTEPSPNYTLRDLVHMFVNRVELLPEDESMEEHERGKRAEAKVLADDRKGGGVFHGRFKRTRPPLFGPDGALRDVADGVDRCPKCMWEMEDGECNSCGWPRIDDYSDDDDFDSADDLDGLHSLDGFPDGFPAGFPAGYMGPRNYAYFDGTDQSADDLSADEDEHDSELDDFIDDEADEEDDYPTELDPDDGLSDHTDTYDAYASTANDHTDTGLSTDNGSDDDVQGPYQRALSVHDRRVGITETDTSQEDDGSESETATQATNYNNGTDAPHRVARILPSARSFSEDDDDDDHNHHDDDDDDDSVQAMPAMRATKRARRRLVIESDEDEDEDEEEGGDESQASGSTTTAQSAAHRLSRLQARRAHNNFSRYIPQPIVSRSSLPTRRTVPALGNWARRPAGSMGGFHRRPEDHAGAGAVRIYPYPRLR